MVRLFKGRTFPGKILLTRKSEPLHDPGSLETAPDFDWNRSENELGSTESTNNGLEVLFPENQKHLELNSGPINYHLDKQ